VNSSMRAPKSAAKLISELNKYSMRERKSKTE
jgi:hypothetical protein